MKLSFLTLLVLIAGLLAGCATVSTVAPTPGATRSGTIRIEVPTDVDIADLPRVMAANSLREMGYTVEPLDFQDNTLSLQALVSGDSDFGMVGPAFAAKAIQEGAKLVVILDNSLNQSTLVVSQAIKQCSDLKGKRVTVPSLTSARAVYLKTYIERHCPSTEIEMLALSGQTNALVGIAAGQLDAAVIDYATMLAFENEEHVGVHALVRFINEFPGSTGAQIVTRREMLEKNPQAIKDLIRATMIARQQLQDPKVFQEQLVKYRKITPEEAAEYVKVVNAKDLWSLDGGLSDQTTQALLDFMVETGNIEPGLKAADLVDAAPLNAVLVEMGIQSK